MARGRSSPAWACVLVLLCALAWGLRAMGAPAPAPHPGLATTGALRVERNGRVELTLTHDALAYALNERSLDVTDEAMHALLDGAREKLDAAMASGWERFARELQVRVGRQGAGEGERVTMRVVRGPTGERVLAWKAAHAPPKQMLLPVKMEFAAEGTVPRGTRWIALRFPEVLGDVVVTVQTPGEEPVGAPVREGQESERFPVDLDAPLPAIMRQGGAAAPPAKGSGVSSWRSAVGFVVLGFEHILPMGLDHILFVLGLFFLSPKIKPLLLQVTAFTLAHSVTLALSASGVVRLPGSVVEPLIAASIAFVAIENICTRSSEGKVHWWRMLVVFVFGLIHGLGFASAFAEAFGAERIPLGPVLLFNVGVELGQLAVVGLALLAVGWFVKKKWYRARIAIPCSVLIALVGAWWTVQRVFM